MTKNSNKKLFAALALGLSTSCSLHNSKSHMATVEGIDISHHQGSINWEELTLDNSGKSFIIAKATEGKTWQDPRFLDNFRNICANGFQAGAYHRLRFGTGSTPKEQADNLFNQLRLADNEWATKKPIISLNTIFVPTDRDDYTVVSEYAKESVMYIKDNYSITPYIYTTTSFWDEHVKETPEIVKECPLWIARWRDQEPSPAELPNGWNEWTIWHHSDQGSVPGITGNTDLDKMKVPS